MNTCTRYVNNGVCKLIRNFAPGLRNIQNEENFIDVCPDGAGVLCHGAGSAEPWPMYKDRLGQQPLAEIYPK